MKTSIRKTLVLIAASPLLMAILCEKQEEVVNAVRNQTKVVLSQESNFSVGDTLWIQGKVSSMMFNADTGDSIMNTNDAIRDIISVMRLKTQVNRSNTMEAVNEFEIASPIGSTSFLSACPTSELIANAPLSIDGQEYEYRIGLIPNNAGDFVLSWVEPVDLKNNNLNNEILEGYPLDGSVNALGLLKCDVTYSISNVVQNRREFFFSVN